MSHNKENIYNVDAHIAEIYDQQETFSDDVQLLLALIGERGPLRVFEPFCGTGRMLIPLAQAGHQLTGLDQSGFLLAACREKLKRLGLQAQLLEADAVEDAWPGEMDLVVMGGNCLYELATPDEQARCIQSAASALKPGGYLFLDNDHMEGELAPAWQDTAPWACFPTGLCADGVRLAGTIQTIWFDAPARLARFRRQITAIFPDGQRVERVNIQQKHPVSTGEVDRWLRQSGFSIEQHFGDRTRAPYQDGSPRSIFWARRQG